MAPLDTVSTNHDVETETITISRIDSDTSQSNERKIKCVIWDLDNTLWDGVLVENDVVNLKSGVEETIRMLDNRGILQSIASKNDEQMAMAKLAEFGLSEYFIYPEIHWSSKASSVKRIALSINIHIESIAFIDDQPFELAEVGFAHPHVLCIHVDQFDGLLDMPELTPRFVTDESRFRRQLYQRDIVRNNVETQFEGCTDEFLASLNMRFTVSVASEEDLKRVEELTLRTHQLNSTGYSYSYDELDSLRRCEDHLLLVASLEDKFGSYGKIGVALIQKMDDLWVLKLMLMSCRVMSRGVGTFLLKQIMFLAKDAGVPLEAEWVETKVNRMMYMTYRFANFKEYRREGDLVILRNDLDVIGDFPGYVQVHYKN